MSDNEITPIKPDSVPHFNPKDIIEAYDRVADGLIKKEYFNYGFEELDIITPEKDVEPQDCPACNGKGEYTGLRVVEKCKECGGTGAYIPF